MTFEQKSQWAYGFAALATTLGYVIWLGVQLADRPAADIDYVPALLWTLGLSFLIHSIGGGMARGRGRAQDLVKDDRDRAVNLRGDAQSFFVFSIAAVPALVLAIVDADTFWIANALFAAYALTAVYGVIAKSVLYARGTGVLS